MNALGGSPRPGARFRVQAPAKVNLTLRILERMDDGFHRIETLFQAVGLEDTITIDAVPGNAVALTCRSGQVGPPDQNLVVRAAEAFRSAAGVAGGLHIHLDKRIPVGAGLGGGSSDAGATLRALNELHGRPLDPDALRSVGAELGADVAFFTGSAAYAMGEGRGERLTPLAPLPTRTLILGLPRVHVATGPAYGALARMRAQPGSVLPEPVLEGGAPRGWAEVMELAVNDFEAVVPVASPPVAEALASLRDSGAPLALLSGSGGAVFGLPWSDDPGACLASLRASAPGVRWEAVPTLATLPAPREVVREDGIR